LRNDIIEAVPKVNKPDKTTVCGMWILHATSPCNKTGQEHNLERIVYDGSTKPKNGVVSK